MSDSASASPSSAAGAPAPAAQLQRLSAARATGVRVRAGGVLRGWSPPVVVTLLALASIAATALLQQRAGTYEQAQVRLANVATEFNLVGVRPLELVNGLMPVSTVTAQMRSGELAVNQQLAALRHGHPVSGLAAITGPMQGDFAAVNAILAILSRDAQLSRPTNLLAAVHLGVTANNAGVATTRAIDRAKTQYSQSASRAKEQSILGSALAVLALLAAFLLFYRRALRARTAAQRARTAAESLAEDLGRSEAHLAAAQRQADIGSWEWIAADQRLVWSAEQARLHHWAHEQPPGDLQEFVELVDTQYRRELTGALQRACASGVPLSLQYAVSGPGGSRIIHCQATSSQDSAGRYTGLVGTCQDVTDRFLRAEAERASQAKDEFLSRMSHELRTPLNAILGFSQLLEMGELTDRQHANVDQVLKAGGHLLELINEVLQISRLESRPDYLALEPIAAARVLGDAIDLVTPLAEARRIVISAREEHDEPWLLADEQHLRQVLLNLLSNAIKYNDDGGRVQVRLRRTEEQRVEIAVADDGPGIAPELLVRLFTPFDRLGAEQGNIEGTGLGLALSKAFVEAMGGTLGVQSTPGKGSIFTVELDAATPIYAPDDSCDDDDVSADERRLVLCVDDNPANLELIEQIFAERPQATVVSAVQGRIAVDLARKQRPDLILVDLNLPDINGEEVIALLQGDPATAQIPFIAISADAAPDRQRHVLELGALAYVTKPFDIAELLRLVDEALLATA